MRRIHLIGRKNSGKTTLLVQLIEHLTGRGVRVGAVKHTHHHHELDVPGKDSHRHREAGAAVVAILAPRMTAVFRPHAEEQASAARFTAVEAAFADCDVVLVEGWSTAEAPKIEVWRAAVGAPPLAEEVASVRAVVTDDALHTKLPVWPRSDLARIAAEVLALARA